MEYPPLLKLAGEPQYRARYHELYCHAPIMTFDGIAVRFRRSRFGHCFFESSRRNKDKDRFSLPRAERMEWIKVALADSNSERYWGWDKNRKRYDRTRRVAVVKGNYIVVIMLTGQETADFVTAYVADTVGAGGRKSTIEMIRSAPRWT